MSIEKLNTEIRQEQIVLAALSLIAVQGLKGLSIVKIARRVGIVPSAIYRHFKNKDEVLDATIAYIQKRLLDNITSVCQETSETWERLKQLLMLHIKLIRENQGIPRIIFSEDFYNGHPKRKDKIYGIIKGYLERISEIISQGKQKGQMHQDINPATASLMFLGIIQPAAILWHMSDGEFDVTKHAEKAWEIFRECIRAK